MNSIKSMSNQELLDNIAEIRKELNAAENCGGRYAEITDLGDDLRPDQELLLFEAEAKKRGLRV